MSVTITAHDLRLLAALERHPDMLALARQTRAALERKGYAEFVKCMTLQGETVHLMRLTDAGKQILTEYRQALSLE